MFSRAHFISTDLSLLPQPALLLQPSTNEPFTYPQIIVLNSGVDTLLVFTLI